MYVAPAVHIARALRRSQSPIVIVIGVERRADGGQSDQCMRDCGRGAALKG
jgi:hypothetical protein